MLISKLISVHKKYLKIKKNLVGKKNPIIKCILEFPASQNKNLMRVKTLKKRLLICRPSAFQKNDQIAKKRNGLKVQSKVLNVIFKHLNILPNEFVQVKHNYLFYNPNFLIKNKKIIKSLFRDKSDRFITNFSKAKEITNKKQQKSTISKQQTQKMLKKLADHYNGTAEQNLYTGQEEAELKAFEREKQIIKNNYEELTPRFKAELSSPSPSPDSEQYEKEENLPTHRQLSVKDSNAPGKFVPQSCTNHSEQKNLPNAKISGKNKKIYPSNSKHFKSQMYEITDGTPKMKALMFDPHNLTINYTDVAVPTQIRKDEVLVEVAYSGVSGRDLQITDGRMSCGEMPMILGHEISGKVYAKGSDVHHIQLEDNVAINPYTSCFVCRYCTRGLYSACINEGLNTCIGLAKNGGWAEYVIAKKTQTYKIPPDLSLAQASLMHPLSCVLCALNKLKLSIELDILIQGVGLAGSLWAAVLHSKGYRNVLVCDERKKQTLQFSALNLDYPVICREDIDRYSTDVIIECTGSCSSIEKSLKTINPNGQICLFGKPSSSYEIRFTPQDIVKREITIVGNSGNSLCFSKSIDLANAMGDRYLNFEKLGVKVFSLKDFKRAFNEKKAGEARKIMFKVESL